MAGGSLIGSVSSAAAWQVLGVVPEARLIDCRSEAEWQSIGVPDLASLGKQVVFAQWQYYPSGQVNSEFVAELLNAGLVPDQQLYFLCRSGVRSLAAAQAALHAGFATVFNVVDGFEGQPDQYGVRGRLSGWQAAGLPWRYRSGSRA